LLKVCQEKICGYRILLEHYIVYLSSEC
jgi:hypothetical protein